MASRRGWYVFTKLSNGKTEVHGGPFPTRGGALNALYDGMKVTRSAMDCNLGLWSAADIERRKTMLIFSKEATDAN